MTARTILVVEDDPLVRSYVGAVLESAALPCLQAQTGGEALRILENSPAQVGLMLLDLSLPDMPGMEVAARASTLCPNLPVVVMSGHGIDAVREALTRESIAGFLQKPFLPDELIAHVAQLLPDDETPQPT